MAGGKGGGGNQTVTQVLDPQSQQFLDMFRNASQQGFANVMNMDPSQLVPGADPQFMQSLQAMQGISPDLGQIMDPARQFAMQNLGFLSQDPRAQADPFQSQFTEQVIEAQRPMFERQRQQAQVGAEQQAIGTGAFGGERAGIQFAEAQAGVNRQQQQFEAQARERGFGQAQGLAAQQRQLAQQGLFGGLGQMMGAQQFGSGLQMQQAMQGMGAGQYLQQLAQQRAQMPLQQQQMALGMLGGGLGQGGTTTTQQGGGNLLGGVAGGALSGFGMGGPVGGLVGGGLGLLGGLFG